MTTASLAYRKNAEAIWDGRVPEKYLRILPHITGKHILEIGAAEGVLSLLMADHNPSASVTALEMSHARYVDAVTLQARWRSLGRNVDGCEMVCGDIRQRFDLLSGVETLVASRTIYHLGESIHDVFAAIWAAGVQSVVLVGNPNRAKWPNVKSPKMDETGQYNRYAGVAGMRTILEWAGYEIGTVVTEGDPIVTGHR